MGSGSARSLRCRWERARSQAVLSRRADPRRMSATAVEVGKRFACFGGECSVLITGPRLEAERALEEARSQLLAWHDRFTRFAEASELSRLNADPRETVPVSRSMAR